MSRIEVSELVWTAGGRTLLDGISFSLPPGRTLGLIGPNGSGKSSLLRCVAGIRAPDSGTISYDGTALARLAPRQRAHHLAFVEQMHHSETELRVRDIVALGRIPHRQRPGRLTETDDGIVRAALETMDLSPLAERSWRTMSGGEKQRANIARALAQRARVLVLDEPTNHLDIRHQIDILRLLRAMPQAVLVCLHDLNLAARYCQELIVLQEGRLVAHGPPRDVLTPALLREVFAIEARLVSGEDGSCELRITH